MSERACAYIENPLKPILLPMATRGTTEREGAHFIVAQQCRSYIAALSPPIIFMLGDKTRQHSLSLKLRAASCELAGKLYYFLIEMDGKLEDVVQGL